MFDASGLEITPGDVVIVASGVDAGELGSVQGFSVGKKFVVVKIYDYDDYYYFDSKNLLVQRNDTEVLA